MQLKAQKIIFPLLLVSVLLAAMLRFHLSVYRYFDPDEFAHLHWAYHFVIGQVPYQDFFIYHIPIYQWFLLPLFLLPQSPETILFSRVIMYALFIATALIVGHITYLITHKKETALMAFLLLCISPILADKGIEVRPDMLMIFFYVVPLWLLLTKPHTTRLLFISGILSGLSLLTFQKIIFALPALAVLIVYPQLKDLMTHKRIPILPWKLWGAFIGGGLLVGISFLVYLMANGVLFSGLDAIIRTTSEIYGLGIMRFSPFLTLTPWPLVYVDYEGPSLPWALNTFLLFAMLGGTFILAIEKKWKLFFFFLTFYIGAILYLIVFPTPFVQYFVPVVLIGIPTAVILLWTIIQLIPRGYPRLVLVGSLCMVCLVSYFQQYQIRMRPENSSTEQMQVIRDIVGHVKPDETVYDMTGSYVYRPPGYVLCCHRYANFIQTLKPTPPGLSVSLMNNKTKFIVLDRNGYVFWLVPEPDLSFIKTNYIESPYKKIYSVGYRYRCNSQRCMRINYEGGTLPALSGNIVPIIFEETYKIHTIPAGLSININEKKYEDQTSMYLTPENYQVTADSNIQEFSIQLDR